VSFKVLIFISFEKYYDASDYTSVVFLTFRNSALTVITLYGIEEIMLNVIRVIYIGCIVFNFCFKIECQQRPKRKLVVKGILNPNFRPFSFELSKN